MIRTLPGHWGAVVLAIEIGLFGYFVLVNAFYVLTAAIALSRLPFFMRLHRIDPLRRSYSSLDVPVSMIVPAYNEQAAIVRTVRSLLAVEYPTFELIVINDGSSDETLSALGRAFALEPYPDVSRISIPTQDVRAVYRSADHPALRVIDKINGGKADALNAGINAARYPLVLTADADSYYRPETLEWMTEPFQRDARTVAVGGAVAVGNDCIPQSGRQPFVPRLPKRALPRFQALEYLRAFLSSRLGWAPLNALAIISGACGLWRKDVLVEAGGYRNDTIWEDLEMTLRAHHMLRLQRKPYRISFTPYPVCWTNAPETLRELYHQRVLWHRHLGESVWIHRRLLGSGGALGWLTLPYLVCFEWMAPVAVLFGLIFTVAGLCFGFLDWRAQIVLVALVLTLATLISFVAILLDEMSFSAYQVRDMWTLFLAALTENAGYRQFAAFANLVGVVTWAFRTTYRGRKPPGLFTPAYPHGGDVPPPKPG